MLFGPPGAGGLDLAALNIQRGRDHGIPHYNVLRESYGLLRLTSFSQITSDPALRQKLETVYQNDINNIDAWIGGLAEDHLPGTSLGPLFTQIITSQFTRSRDGDRLFYRGSAAGLYASGVLNPQIASLVNLDALRLSDVIAWNTGADSLQTNVFFAAPPTGTGAVDLAAWQSGFGRNADGDMDHDGDTDGADFLLLQRQLASTFAATQSIPEPATLAQAIAVFALLYIKRRRRVPCPRPREHVRICSA